MAGGQAIREKKITIRISENLYSKLEREAAAKCISFSEQVRWRLENKEMNTGIVSQICRLLTTLNNIFGKYDIEDGDKKLMGEEVEKLWQHLN